jgi:hypothetical protein
MKKAVIVLLCAMTVSGVSAQTDTNTTTPSEQLTVGTNFTNNGFTYTVLDASSVEDAERGVEYVALTSAGSFTGDALKVPVTVTYAGTTYTVAAVDDKAFSGVASTATLHVTESFAKLLGSAWTGNVHTHHFHLTTTQDYAQVQMAETGKTYTLPAACTDQECAIGVTWEIDTRYQNTANATVSQDGVVTIGNSGYAYALGTTELGETVEYTLAISDFMVDRQQYNVITEPDGDTHGTVRYYFADNYDEYIDDVDCFIPSQVEFNGKIYDVTTIGQGAFYANMCYRIVVPSSVTTIEREAFHEYGDVLGELVLGKNVSHIGIDAFETCERLVDVISLNPIAPEVELTTEENETAFATTTLHLLAGADIEASYEKVWNKHFADVIYHKLTFAATEAEIDVNTDAAGYQVAYTCIDHARNSAKTRAALSAEELEAAYAKYSYLGWTSSDEDVATVDATTGKVTPVAMGSCTISATSIFGETADLALTVNDYVTTSISDVEAAEAPASTVCYDLLGRRVAPTAKLRICSGKLHLN